MLAREVDKVEAIYQTGKPLSEAIYDSYRMSSSAYAGWYGDDLVCVWGVCALAPMSGIGVPWLVATPALENAAVPFLRHCWYYLNKMKSEYEFLFNMVYSENDTAIQWLSWMGFEMSEAEPHGPMSMPFIPFRWKGV